MNLLFPDNLAQQPPRYQLMWLVIIIIGCYCIFSAVAVMCLLLAGYDLDTLSGIDFSAIGSQGLMLYKMLQIIATIALFVTPACLFSYLQTNNLRYLQLNHTISLRPLLLTLAIAVLSFPVIAWLAQINQAIELPALFDKIEAWMRLMEEEAKDMTIAFLSMDNPLDLLFNLIMVAVLPALGEEMLFRGCLQRVFYRFFNNPHCAIWLAAAVFSFIHFQFYGFVPRMVIGALLGYLYYFSGNLWYPIIGHFLNNGIQVIGVYFVPSELTNADTVGLEKIPLYFPLLSAVFLYLGFKHFRQFFDSIQAERHVRQLD